MLKSLDVGLHTVPLKPKHKSASILAEECINILKEQAHLIAAKALQVGMHQNLMHGKKQMLLLHR